METRINMRDPGGAVKCSRCCHWAAYWRDKQYGVCTRVDGGGDVRIYTARTDCNFFAERAKND